MTEVIIFFLTTLILTIFCKKFNLIPNFSGDNHQFFLKQNKVPLIGGVLFLILSIYFFYAKNIILCYSIFFIFTIGFFSDTRIINSPKIRIFLQVLVISITVYMLDIQISSTRINLLDKIIDIKFNGFIFCIFCLMILINGSNFIDGLNGLLLGYLLIILFILLKLDLLDLLQFNKDLKIFLFSSLLIMLIFNFLNFFYLGDSGSYSIGLVLGYLLITIYNLSNSISPFFIILLLWYPCFENLFSILRKNKLKNSPIVADDKHLHQLLYFYIQKKFFKNNLLSNNFSSILVNCYNFILIFTASKNISSTNFQVFLLVVNIFVYLICYKYLFSFRFIKK